jgi:hypothetical protein
VLCGHAVAVLHAVHPLAWTAHVSTPSLVQRAVPFAHAFVQQAPALHAPFVQFIELAS